MADSDTDLSFICYPFGLLSTSPYRYYKSKTSSDPDCLLNIISFTFKLLFLILLSLSLIPYNAVFLGLLRIPLLLGVLIMRP